MNSHLRRKVLIAYDNSDFSAKMFDWALGDILRGELDHVVLATVLDVQESTFIHTHWMRDSSAGRQGHARRVSTSEYDELTAHLKPLVERLIAKGVTAQIRVLKGDAKAKLVELAEEVRADLMIVGARGLGPIRRLTMGSVSDYCVHNAECPVLVAKSIDATLARSKGRRGSSEE
ncbi:hypothetical protein BC936DRAFT_147917 [Jimgerdemannia flammicorona]|uniref:Uncharacterized protein n=2 Tax=Jimgerdemannia flammicorona TaxID=994334 RepID=A0A433QCD9_9FUNG|nr:hypothetical protein BC936DRAFT_147917 [Jimgerdemannia flammicorona]RUS27476.1 hypothetical protein BC938DRAFT_483205 [Jimgerdemannia flammicorona]